MSTINTYGLFQIIVSIIFVIFVFKMILPARGVEQITADELRKRLKDVSIQFIDVRPPRKYHQFHIYGFENITLRDIRKEAANLDKSRPIVVICQTCAQANRACKRLKRKGFTKLANVRGGLSTWDPIHIDRT